MLRRTPRPLALGASLALTAGILLTGSTAASAAGPPSVVALDGSAYGSTASVGPVTSGRTAAFFACSTTPGDRYGNDVAATDLGPGLGEVGAVVTTGSRTDDTMTVTSTTGATDLLGGLVRAEAITSTSTSTTSGSRLRSSGSTVISGLEIAGVAEKVSSRVDRRIKIPGVATVTINHQKTTKTSVSRRLTVEALRIDLLKGNRLGLAQGSIVVGSSRSGASKPTSFAASGLAYGTSVDVDGVVVSGPTANVGMPCGGTGGKVVKNEVARASVPGAVKVRAVSSTGRSKDSSSKTKAVFTDEVEHVNLFDGAVTATSVKAEATTTRSRSTLKSSDDGTRISHLKVLGLPVKVSSKPNSTIDVAGLGTLTVHKTVEGPDGLEVTGLELRLSTDRAGVKAGTVVKVAVARSGVAAR